MALGENVGENVGENTSDTGSAAFLAPPTNVYTGTVTTSTMGLSWTAPAEGAAIGYRVYDFDTLLLKNTVAWGTTSTTVTGLSEGTVYRFYVVTYNDYGESVASNSAQGITDTTVPTPAGVLFQDYFDTGSIAGTQNGITWDMRSGSIGPPVVTTEQKFSGTHSLKFPFPALPDVSDPEARMLISRSSAYKEFWIQYYVYYASNFVHEDLAGTDNNKFFVAHTFADGLDYCGPNIETNVRGSKLDAPECRYRGRYEGLPTSVNVPVHQYGTIDSPVEIPLATWTKIKIHLKLATYTGTSLNNDGVFQFWVGDHLVMDYSNLGAQAFTPTAPPLDAAALPYANGEAPKFTNTNPNNAYWDFMYFFGACNSDFNVATATYIDNLVIASDEASLPTASTKILFSSNFENGVSSLYLGASNAHPGGGYISYLGGQPLTYNPGDGTQDVLLYNNVILDNSAEAQGSIPGSTTALKTHYAVGKRFSYPLNTTIIRFPEQQQVYIRFYQKWGADWQWGTQQKFNKMKNHALGDCLSQSFGFYSSYLPGGIMVLSKRSCLSNSVPSCSDLGIGLCVNQTYVFADWGRPEETYRKEDSLPNNSNFIFNKNQWYCIEMYLKCSTNLNNAEFRYWIDDVLAFEYTGTYNREIGVTAGIDTVELQHVAYPEYAFATPTWMDNIVISTSRIYAAT